MSAVTENPPIACPPHDPAPLNNPAPLSGAKRQTADELLVNRRSLSDNQRQELEQLAFDHACVPESYDIAVSDGHVLRTPCGRGAVSVLADGRYWHIAGGLLAPEALKPKMIGWLRELSEKDRRTIAVYNVPLVDALRFQETGFVVNKFGEEAFLNPQDVDWSGKMFEWVRRQSNFCTRSDVVICEITDPEEQLSLGPALLSIMSEDLSWRTLDKPLRLLEGEFKPHVLQRRRLFVAKRRHEDDIEAFLACSPVAGGRGWAFETYRKRRNSTRGVTTFIFRTVIDQLRHEGVEYVSLCLIPGRNVKHSTIGNGDWRIRTVLSIWFDRMDFVFNAKGQDHFKSRFRPEYADRFLCVAPRNSITSLWSFLKTTGAMNCNWVNLAGLMCHSVFKR